MTDILTLVGICDPITDPLLDGESNCQNFAGDVVKITRTCPTPPCQLGLCGAGVFSNCDCSKTQIGSDYFDKSITAYRNETSLISDTYIKTKFQREGTSVRVNMTTISYLPDSVSTVCGEILDGIKFCGFNRQAVILDSQGIELDL